MGLLELQAEAIAGEFNSQDIEPKEEIEDVEEIEEKEDVEEREEKEDVEEREEKEDVEDIATTPSAYAKMGEGGREKDRRIVE